jgi:hypothetical protein
MKPTLPTFLSALGSKMSLFKNLSSLLVLLLFSGGVSGQTTLISPTGNGGFETGATFADNSWIAVNSSTDGWYVGAVPVTSAGTKCAYISSTAGAAWTYSQFSVVQHLYYDVTIPANESKITLSFKWKANGEGTTTSDYDNLKVFWGVASAMGVPIANTALASTYQVSGAGATSGMYKLSSASYNTETISFNGTPGTTYRLVFSWKSDSSTIANPPAAIDLVSLTSSAPSTITSTATGGNWSTGATWVGGVVPAGGDNVTIANGATVTIDSAAANPVVNNLTVGGGTSGTLIYNATAAQTLSAANITVNSGATLSTAATGTIITHILDVFGNITNSGTIDLSTTATNVAGATLRFSGSGNSTYSGTGAVNDL